MIRAALVAGMAVVTLSLGVRAQTLAARALPLDNLGLEHLDIVVPDPAASAQFYARIFKTALHQQPVRDTLRYFVLLGDLPADRQVGYIAIGAAGGRAAGDRPLLRAGEGVRPGRHGQRAASGRLRRRRGGADGHVARSGSARTAAVSAAGRSGDGGRAVAAAGRRRRAAHRRAASITCCCASAASRSRCRPTGWCTARRLNGRATQTGASGFISSATRASVLEEAPPGQAPTIAHYAIKVAPFDRGALRGATAGTGRARASVSRRARRRALRGQQRDHRRGEVTKAMKTWRAVHVLAAAIVWQLGPMADAQTPPVRRCDSSGLGSC